jgi:hypothetical protein
MQTREPRQAGGGGGGRAARRQREAAAARQRRVVMLAGGAIVLLVVVLIVVRFVLPGSSGGAATTDGPVPQAMAAQVTGVDPATLDQVGRGTLAALPTPVRTTVTRGPDGKPQVTYIGAEYCPFCAAERWPLVIALSRFGTFDNLQLSHSAADDVFPNTPTFSFVGSTYSSPYISFNPVELQGNVRSGNTYPTLQTPTAAQTNIIRMYDAPPYVPAQSAGAIPFIDFAGQYVMPGASFDASVLRGMSADQIAASLSDPSSPQAKAILGSANALTAAICSATGDMPAEVCNQPAIKSLESALAVTPVPGGTQ